MKWGAMPPVPALSLVAALLAGSGCGQPGEAADGGDGGVPPDGGSVLLTGAAAENAVSCGVGPDLWIPGAADGGAATATADWSLRFGDVSDDGVNALVAGPDGAPVVLSTQYAVVDFGTGAYAVPASCPTMLSAFSPSGALRWSRSVSSWAPSVGLAPDGRLFVALTDNSVASLTPDGQAKWVWRTSQSLDFQLGVSADALFVAGLGASTNGVYAAALQRLSFDGAPVWSFAFPSASWPIFDVSSTDEVVLVVGFAGTTVFGGQTFQSAGADDFIVAKLGADGTLAWARQFGTDAEDGVPGVAFAPDGSIVLFGFSSGALDFGSGPVAAGGGGFVAYLARLDADGNGVAGRSVSSSLSSLALKITPSGQIVVGSNFSSPVDIDGTTVHTGAMGDIDFLVIETSPSFDVQKILHFGNGGGNQQLTGMAVDAHGGVLLGGKFQGKLDLGAGTMRSAGGQDAFLGRVQP